MVSESFDNWGGHIVPSHVCSHEEESDLPLSYVFCLKVAGEVSALLVLNGIIQTQYKSQTHLIWVFGVLH